MKEKKNKHRPTVVRMRERPFDSKITIPENNDARGVLTVTRVYTCNKKKE